MASTVVLHVPLHAGTSRATTSMTAWQINREIVAYGGISGRFVPEVLAADPEPETPILKQIPRMEQICREQLRAAMFTRVSGFQLNLSNIIAGIIGAAVLERSVERLWSSARSRIAELIDESRE